MIPDNQKEMFAKKLVKWGKVNIREFPWRRENSPLVILIIEVFLQKTPAERVAARYQDIISAFTADSANLDEDSLAEQFRDLGLRKRVRWLIQSLQIIDERYDGVVPNQIEDLLGLPGIGLYTASAVSCFTFNKPVPLIDVNIIRVLSRVFDVISIKPLKIESEFYELAASLVPEDSPYLYNYSLLDLGAMICKKIPDCLRCPVRSVCQYFKNHKSN